MTQIFTFGSNEAGRHGKGAALYARQHHGAIYGQGVGLQGQSYAIPTEDENIRTLPLDRIKPYVEEFIAFAKAHSEMVFQVTAIGTGLAGYKPSQIAPMFGDAPENCLLPPEFLHELGRDRIGTPWGQSDYAKQIAPGITFYSTPDHGGFHLSEERIAEMPKPLREFQPFNGNHGWYEEDCDWSIVALAFPQYFTEDDHDKALATIKHYRPALYEQIDGKKQWAIHYADSEMAAETGDVKLGAVFAASKEEAEVEAGRDGQILNRAVPCASLWAVEITGNAKEIEK